MVVKYEEITDSDPGSDTDHASIRLSDDDGDKIKEEEEEEEVSMDIDGTLDPIEQARQIRAVRPPRIQSAVLLHPYTYGDSWKAKTKTLRIWSKPHVREPSDNNK